MAENVSVAGNQFAKSQNLKIRSFCFTQGIDLRF